MDWVPEVRPDAPAGERSEVWRSSGSGGERGPSVPCPGFPWVGLPELLAFAVRTCSPTFSVAVRFASAVPFTVALPVSSGPGDEAVLAAGAGVFFAVTPLPPLEELGED